MGALPGDSLAGRYRVDKFLGRGGFARALLGHDEQLLDKPIVIKEVLASSSASDANTTLEREAATLNRLKHAAIPTCHAYFEELGHRYLVLEYMPGPTLLEAIAGHGKFATEIVRNVLERLLDAVGYLHMQDPPLVHGDLSPENIVLMASGRVSLIDFGTIRPLLPASPRSDSDVPVGKEVYAAPELRRGDVCPASDLYALGVTALYMLAGRHPRELFDATEGCFKWDDSALSPLLNTVIRRLLAPDLRDRFASASEALDALDAQRPIGSSLLPRRRNSTSAPPDSALPPFSQLRAPYHLGGGPAALGRLSWRYKVGPLMSSPALKSGILYLGSLDRVVTALDAFTGRLMWRFAAKASIACSPAIADQQVLVGDESGAMYALDAFNGMRQWTFKTGSPLGSSPVIADAVAYFGANDGYLYAVDAGGTEAWRCLSNPNDRIRSSPAISGPLVFVGTHGGSFFAFDRFAGLPRWEFHTRGAITTTPVVSEGRVFVGCRAGGFYGLDAVSGGLLWEFQAPAGVDGSPAIAANRVYFGCRDGAMYCLDVADGRLIWKFTIGASGTPTRLSAIALLDGTLYLGTDSGRFYALEALEGQVRWWFQASAPVRASAIIAHGLVYVPCEDGYVYAIG